MSALYTLAIDAAIGALIDAHGPVTAVMVDATYTFDQTDTVLGDIAGIVGTAETCTVAGIANGTLSIDPVAFVGVDEGHTIAGVVFYLAGNGQLLCHVDTRDDYTPVGVETNGGAITFTFDRLLKM